MYNNDNERIEAILKIVANLEDESLKECILNCIGNLLQEDMRIQLFPSLTPTSGGKTQRQTGTAKKKEKTEPEDKPDWFELYRIIIKLHAGGILTNEERTILEKAGIDPNPPTSPIGITQGI